MRSSYLALECTDKKEPHIEIHARNTETTRNKQKMHLSIRKSENWSDKAAEMKVIMQQSTMMINSYTDTFIPCTSPIAGCTR